MAPNLGLLSSGNARAEDDEDSDDEEDSQTMHAKGGEGTEEGGNGAGGEEGASKRGREHDGNIDEAFDGEGDDADGDESGLPSAGQLLDRAQAPDFLRGVGEGEQGEAEHAPGEGTAPGGWNFYKRAGGEKAARITEGTTSSVEVGLAAAAYLRANNSKKLKDTARKHKVRVNLEKRRRGGGPGDEGPKRLEVFGEENAVRAALKELQSFVPFSLFLSPHLVPPRLSRVSAAGVWCNRVAKEAEKEVTHRMRVEPNEAGLVIGKGGEEVKRLQRETGASVQVLSPTDGSSGAYRFVEVTGGKAAVEEACERVLKLIEGRSS